MKLPCLLLDYRGATNEEMNDSRFFNSPQWVCEYKILIPVPEGDIRDPEKRGYAEGNLGSTICAGPAPDQYGRLNTPYRDGVHILRDMEELRLPAYVRYGEKIERLFPKEPGA